MNLKSVRLPQLPKINGNLSYKHTAASSSLSREVARSDGGLQPPCIPPSKGGDFVQYVIQVNFRLSQQLAEQRRGMPCPSCASKTCSMGESIERSVFLYRQVSGRINPAPTVVRYVGKINFRLHVQGFLCGLSLRGAKRCVKHQITQCHCEERSDVAIRPQNVSILGLTNIKTKGIADRLRTCNCVVHLP